MADVISNLVPPALNDGEAVPSPVKIKYKDMGDGSYAPVVAVDASSIAGEVAVVTDATLTGDGTTGDPLSVAGGGGVGPVWREFSWRGSGGSAGNDNYFPIAPLGIVGAGGITTSDPTDPANYSPNEAGYMAAGTLSNFYIYQQEGPGVGETATFSIRVNGATPVNGIEVILSGNSEPNSGSDTTHTVAVPLNALVAIRMDLSAGTTGRRLSGRVLFTPS